MQKEIAATFIIFGGSGDLAHRKLYPALFNLFKKGLINEHFAVIGTARRPWTHDYFREIVKDAVATQNDDQEAVSKFIQHFYYQSHDVTDTKHYQELDNLANELDTEYGAEGNRVFYMAMSPMFFGTIATHIHDEDILGKGFNRLIIEKPFGHDQDTATELNAQINASFAENDVYRIDHYLGKEIVQDILPLRFSNPTIEMVWNKDYIKNVQITLAEQLGVEARGGYYETAGALRDMVQNHIFQIATALAMKKPQDMTAEAIHKSKQELLNSLVSLSDAEITQNFVRGQYLGDDDTLAYTSENQVDSESKTETFVAGKIEFATGPLMNVPFYIRTGKRMAVKKSVINIVFKANKSLYPTAAENILSLEIDPAKTISLYLNGKRVAHDGIKVQKLLYDYNEHIEQQVPDAYERLIGDALKSDRTNFTNWDELKASWKYIDAIEANWQKRGEDGLYLYKPFCMGPKEDETIFAGTDDGWVLD